MGAMPNLHVSSCAILNAAIGKVQSVLINSLEQCDAAAFEFF